MSENMIDKTEQFDAPVELTGDELEAVSGGGGTVDPKWFCYYRRDHKDHHHREHRRY